MMCLYLLFCRIPIPLCKKLGSLTAKYRWFALVYIIGMFFVLPGLFVGLTFIDKDGIAMYSFLGFMVFTILAVVFLNFLQSNERLKTKLPVRIQNWYFLPECLRSLEPYDR